MTKYTFIILLSLLVLVSCDSNDSEAKSDAVEQKVTSVSVMCQQRKAAPGIEMYDDDSNDDKDPINDTAPIIVNSFAPGDLLYFSQMGPSQNPNFNNTDATASPYVYIYRYNNENTSANWDEGYNFSVKPGCNDFDWDMVKQVGSVGNSFSMYAFHFPVDNKVRFSIETNQRGPTDNPYDKDNFKKSDIMGAYHATSSLYTRLRFRLFHLMVYLKVTLYVPVYADEVSDSEMEYSGFNEDAVQGAFVMNAYTDFDISWRANRSSDTEAPLTNTNTAGNKANIIMYRHQSTEDVIEDFNVAEYYTKQDITTDNVRAYHFSVLFPSQTFADNFLCFVLKTPQNETKYYYFSGSQIVGDSGNYGLVQGTLQHLYLYLPRKTNETILVGAKLLPWIDTATDMTVTKQEKTDEDND